MTSPQNFKIHFRNQLFLSSKTGIIKDNIRKGKKHKVVILLIFTFLFYKTLYNKQENFPEHNHLWRENQIAAFEGHCIAFHLRYFLDSHEIIVWLIAIKNFLIRLSIVFLFSYCHNQWWSHFIPFIIYCIVEFPLLGGCNLYW